MKRTNSMLATLVSLLVPGLALAKFNMSDEDGGGNAGAEAAAEAKKIKFAEKIIDEEAGTVTWNFGNGEQRTISLDELDASTQRYAALHGLSQRGGDSYAGASGDYGFALTNLDKILAQLRSGEGWNVKREGSGAGVAKNGELIAAIVQLKGVTEDAAKAAVEGMSEDQRKQVRNHPAVKSAIADARLAKAQAAAAAAKEKAAATPLNF